MLLLQIPHWREHGLQPEDPNDKFSVKGKSLKDMGKDNHDLSAFLRLVACILFLFPLKYRSDLILLDVEGSPFLAIKDVKHAAAAREASTRSEA